MIVSINEDGSVALHEPDVFTAFKVVVFNGNAVTAATALAAAEAGSALTDDRRDEVGVAVAWVRERVVDAGVADGEAQLDGMLGYARSKGWLDDDGGLIIAHVEKA